MRGSAHIMSTCVSGLNNHDLDFLARLIGEENVSTEESELLIHGVDAYPSGWVKPDVVLWPATTDQVSEIVRYANKRRIPIVPRGAGTSLSGNVIPVFRGIVLSFRKMNKIVKIMNKDLQVVVQPGV